MEPDKLRFCAGLRGNIRMLEPLKGALNNAGYGVMDAAADGWLQMRASGAHDSGLLLRPDGDGVLLQQIPADIALQLGLEVEAATQFVRVPSAQALDSVLRLLHATDSHPFSALPPQVEERLAAIPETERTEEVRRRIGQDVFRDALMEPRGGCGALSCMRLPAELLRASHIKPWAAVNAQERLDPCNGLLPAVHYDALFDRGLISFADDGRVLISPELEPPVCSFVGLDVGMRLRWMLPGHRTYLHYHRSEIARLG